MYPHFIEVHYQNGVYDPALINIDNIVLVNSRHIYTTSDRGDECIPVMETYDELKELIEGCGCSINKGDPRLDTSCPLTMADLKDMIGEPVWNSNNGHWMIVEGFSDNGKLVRFQLVGCTRKFVSEQELIKYPLYRIKVAK